MTDKYVQGIDYEHECRACGLSWLESYSLEAFEDNAELQCPECTSYDTYRCIGSKGFTLVGGGVGWSDQGYYSNTAYDSYKELGQSVKLYDNKDDIERELKGERAANEHRKLKYRHELEKKVYGRSTVTEESAKVKIQAEVSKVKV
jgi:predicted nucleic acid-binding Zn ribbon protein